MSQLEQFSTISLENFDQKRKHYEVANKRRVEADNIIDYLVANLESLITSQVISNLKVRSHTYRFSHTTHLLCHWETI